MDKLFKVDRPVMFEVKNLNRDVFGLFPVKIAGYMAWL